MEPFDETYYGLSLVYRYDDRVIDERLWVLKETFYRNLKPIYGNDGHEKGAFSIKQINKTDYDLFNNNFYISQTVLKKMGIQSSRLKEVKTIDGCGIYCPIQDETTSKLVFTAFQSYSLVLPRPPHVRRRRGCPYLHHPRKPPHNGDLLLFMAVHGIQAANLNSFNEFVENQRREFVEVQYLGVAP